MSLLLRLVAILLVAAGAAFSLLNADVIGAGESGDYGGAAASVFLRFVPFALAAVWASNKAAGRRTTWGLIVVLALWVVIGLYSLGRPGH